MHIITLDRVHINHAGRDIFRDLSWAIGNTDRVGLVGPNGAGKSSLLKGIVGEVELQSGAIVRMRGISVGYLPQEVRLTPGVTLMQEALILPPELARLEADLAKIEAQLGNPNVYNDSAALARVLDRQEKLVQQYDDLGGSSYTNTVREMLLRFDFSPADFDLPTDTLSGGQKKLVALTRLLIEAPDVLLLDEPDNHLDLSAKRVLEKLINQYEGAVIIVSHDRYLLDETVTQIAELAEGKITVYPGNYTAYTTERELRRMRQQQLYVAQQKEIARIEAAIKRFELWASLVVDERHIKQARSRRKMLDRMEANGEIIDKVVERRQMDLQLNGGRGSQKALEARHLSMGFGDDLLFLDLNFLIRHGERVGIIGPNGAGKSVLFRLLLGQMQPLEGEVIIGPSNKMGYYAQEHQTLTAWQDRTPLELVRDLKAMDEGSAVSFLMKFIFTYDQITLPIRYLSGGERSRLQLATLMLKQPNLLLLDEPTNNLDIPSCETLENALDEFDGTLVVISHDRYFLDQVVDRVIELDNGMITEFNGGYTDYLTAKSQVVGVR